MNVFFKFLGTHSYSLDDKGRLMLPSCMRDELKKSGHADRLAVSYCPGTRFLTIYPDETFQEIMDKWSDDSRFASSALMSSGRRLFFANVEEVFLDKAGRLLIPGHMREKAGLRRDVNVLGLRDKIEVWAPEMLEAQNPADLDLWAAALTDEKSRAAQMETSAPLPGW